MILLHSDLWGPDRPERQPRPYMERSKRQVKPPKKLVEEDGGPLTCACVKSRTASFCVTASRSAHTTCAYVGLGKERCIPLKLTPLACTYVLRSVVLLGWLRLGKFSVQKQAWRHFSNANMSSSLCTSMFAHSHTAPAHCAAA